MVTMGKAYKKIAIKIFIEKGIYISPVRMWQIRDTSLVPITLLILISVLSRIFKFIEEAQDQI